MLEARETILGALEGLRKAKTIGSAQEAAVTLSVAPADLPLLEASRELLGTLCIVSEIRIEPAAKAAADGPRFAGQSGAITSRQMRAMLELSADRGQEPERTRRSASGACAHRRQSMSPGAMRS